MKCPHCGGTGPIRVTVDAVIVTFWDPTEQRYIRHADWGLNSYGLNSDDYQYYQWECCGTELAAFEEDPLTAITDPPLPDTLTVW